jgi:NADH-quinone oxidoreductase subunit J
MQPIAQPVATTFFFYFLSGLAILSGVLVITRKNPVHSALALILTLLSVAGLYLMLYAPFVAGVQIILYVGGIMVLFLFVIMLLNLQHAAEPTTRPIQQFLGYTTCAAFALGLVYYLVKYAVFATLPDGPFHADARTLGIRIFEAYVFPFEMVSILLLAAIVGALYLSGRALPAKRSAEEVGQ